MLCFSYLQYWPLTSPQDTGVGANPVQIEVGEFDEAIEIPEDEFVEDDVVESKLSNHIVRLVCVTRGSNWSENQISTHQLSSYSQAKR